MKSAHAIELALGLLTAGGCATTVYGFNPRDDRVIVAAQRPFHDLGMMRVVPPESLTRAAENPYALLFGFDCAANLSEIAVLDQVLGPDLRLPGEAGEDGQMDPPGLVADVIGGTIGLPYSNIIRKLTGAAQRDRMLRGAIFAGMVRRSFLRGIVLAGGCPLNLDATIQAGESIEVSPATPKTSAEGKTETATLSPRLADSAD